MYENNTAAVKVGHKVSILFRMELGVKQGCVLSPFIWNILMDILLRSTAKAKEEHRIKWTSKTFLDLVYADDLSILVESVCKMNELLEAFRVQGARIGLRINFKKTKSLRLGISKDKNLTLVNEKFDQVDCHTYLVSTVSKDSG